MVEVGTGTAGTRFLKSSYPHETGLTAGTTKQEGRTENLVAEEEVILDGVANGWGSL